MTTCMPTAGWERAAGASGKENLDICEARLCLFLGPFPPCCLSFLCNRTDRPTDRRYFTWPALPTSCIFHHVDSLALLDYSSHISVALLLAAQLLSHSLDCCIARCLRFSLHDSATLLSVKCYLPFLFILLCQSIYSLFAHRLYLLALRAVLYYHHRMSALTGVALSTHP